MELTFGTYQRVLIVGIDGMGAFNRFADTPNIDRVFARGAVTHTALAAKPTISTACWTTMLTGAIPEVHTAGRWAECRRRTSRYQGSAYRSR